ncbi:YaaC family protein [Actinosynnema sp. NPDC053489]|uniref:YaaC family protein n=1 Tax=Actinosynnema sp. NPDC053489 TaxID=3363916 RepID=UPI0037C7B786
MSRYFTTSKEYWQYLRRLRSAPPPSANANQARRGTFSAALEQSEQLFSAASSVGAEATPILLYYGTYQAGRAIAAANPDTRMPWQLQGHGLKAPNLSDRDRVAPTQRQNLMNMTVRSTGRTPEAYPTISSILNSAPLTEAVELGDLVSLLDETGTRTATGGSSLFPSLSNKPRPLAVDIEVLATRNGVDIVTLKGAPPDLLSAEEPDTSVEEFIRKFFPQFDQQWEIDARAGKKSPRYKNSIHLSRRGEIDTTREPFDERDDDRLALERALNIRRPYYGFSDVIDPTLPSQKTGIHRLCLWWAVLYHLSMVARYTPNAWTADLDVDNSSLAVGLEQLLELAFEEVPQIVGEVISDFHA